MKNWFSPAFAFLVFMVPALAQVTQVVPPHFPVHTKLPDQAELTSSAPQQSDYDMGRQLIRKKQYADAIAHLERALADRPRDAELLNDLGLAKRMTRDYDGALYYDQRALTFDPDDKDAHEDLGELYLAKSDLSSAQKELARLTTLCPSGCDERNALSQSIGGYKPAPGVVH